MQAVPAQEQPVPATPLEALLDAYRQYLEGERGLSASTIRHYLRYARVFLSGFPGPLTQTLQELSAGQVTGHVLEQARRRRQGAPDMVRLPALRSVLRYLHAAGHIPLPLDKAVPAGRAWRAGLPRAVPADHLRAVLASCDRDSAAGRRDYAIVLAMRPPPDRHVSSQTMIIKRWPSRVQPLHAGGNDLLLEYFHQPLTAAHCSS